MSDAEQFGPGGPALERLAAAWAPERPQPVSLAGVNPGLPGLAPELAHWMRLFERYGFELADPAEAELRAPGDLPDFAGLLEGRTGPSMVADLFGVLTASTVVAQIDDLALLASLAGTASGHSRVFAFHPEDWGLEPSAPALSVAFHRLEAQAARVRHPFDSGVRPEPAPDALEAAERYAETLVPESLPAHLDPVRLFRRADWLVRALLGLPFGAARETAPPRGLWREEAVLLPDHPHLLLYWLLASALEDPEAVPELLETPVSVAAPFVEETKSALRAWRSGRDERLGPLERVRVERLAAELAALDTPTVEVAEVSPFEQLLEHLRSGREPGPDAWQGHPPESLEGLLASSAGPEHLRRLDAAIAEGRGVPDTHARAGRGYLLARAAASADLPHFLAALPSPAGYGPRRRDEWWRALARFDEPEVTDRLARGAAQFAREANDWIRTASKAPWDALLARDSLSTHDLAASFCAHASLSAHVVPLWLEVAEAARRHHIVRAAPGLRRAVAGRVGRIHDGDRLALAETTAQLDPEAGPFLAAVANELRLEWEEAEDEDDAELAAAALACVVGPLLSVSDEPRTTALAAALLRQLGPSLAPGRQPSIPSMEALRSLAKGCAARGAGPLLQAMKATRRLWLRAERPDRPPAHRLTAALEALE